MSSDPSTVEVGSPAPDFSLESSDNTSVSPADYRGRRNVLLYFMREFT